MCKAKFEVSKRSHEINEPHSAALSSRSRMPVHGSRSRTARRYCELAVANRRVADANHSLIGSQVQRDQFVRLCDADDFRNTGQVFKTAAIDWAFIACDANRGPRRSRHGMGAKAYCLNNAYHRIDFRCRGTGFHYD